MPLGDRTAVRAGIPLLIGAGAAIGGVALSVLLPGYFVFLGTSAIVAAISLLGLGVVTGSAGMIALCQLSFAVVGAWVVAGLNLINAPGDGILWLVLGGIAAGVVGILVGLPALRLRGVNLAVVTLGFAAAVQFTITQLQFPGSTTYIRVLRPALFSTDRSFFAFAVIVLAVAGVAVAYLRGSRVGSGWRFVAFSERGLAGAGGNVRTTKLSAFAVSATLAGFSGGLVMLQVGIGSPATFAPLQSLALYVFAIVSGSHLIDMAVLGGVLWVGVPEILKRVGINQNWGLVLFGVLGIQALSSHSNLGQTIRDQIARRRPTGRTGLDLAPSGGGETFNPPGETVLELRDVGMVFGQVVALGGVDLRLRAGEVLGLIGPNGSGKSTMIDALSGFLPQHTGQILLAGEAMDRLRPAQLARRGIRRTFQQDRVPPGLSIESYIRFVARRRITLSEIDELLQYFGCPARSTVLSSTDVGTRRVVEIVAQLAARPRVLLLDEPAAGLSHEEHLALGERIAQIPARYGAAVLLVEHDLDLVRRVCPTIAVLDFGRVLAYGGRDEVLGDPRVVKAYMGETELT